MKRKEKKNAREKEGERRIERRARKKRERGLEGRERARAKGSARRLVYKGGTLQ